MPEKCPSCGFPVPAHSPNQLCPACLLGAGEEDGWDEDPTAATEQAPAGNELSHERFVPGDVLGDRYRIASPLGRGGMGVVYRADDLKLRQPVALKFLPRALTGDPRLLEALCNEVRQARRVAHRHVARVYDIGEADGQTFLSMEFIDGEDLGILLRRIGRLPGGKGLELSRQLCAGLAAAHEKGILHLDLKPGNLMIDERGDLRITDFGLARLATDVEGSATRSGTPAYMSPEQALGRPISTRSDLYAVGLILHEIFTGKRPCETRELQELLTWHRAGSELEPKELQAIGLEPRLEQLIFSCLQSDPQRRPASATELLARLDEIGDGRTPSLRARKEPASGSGKSLAALLFTDIVGSVEMQQMLGTDAYTRLVAKHDELFKECLEGIPGAWILNETGDGFLVRFSDPSDAVNTALKLQGRLGALNVSGRPLLVRIGLHMGVVKEMTESVRGETRAVGMPINITARVMGLAQGGQILMTRPVYDDARQYVKSHPEAGSASPAGSLRWMSHGNYRFKGCEDRIDIFEVGTEGLAPLRAPLDSDKAWRDRSEQDAGGGVAEREAEPITADDIEQSDVIISYAPVDDRPLAAGGEGWVTRFHRNLSVRLEQLCGEEVKVLRCPRERDAIVPESVIPSVGRVQTMVPVISPPFVKSDQCCRIVAAFGADLASSGTGRKGLLKAVKTPVAPSDIPAQLAPALTTSLDYKFYEEESESGRLREFDEAFGVDAQKQYYERVYDLAFEVSRNVLSAKRAGQEPSATNGDHKTIFLAEATSDLQAARDRLRRELLDAGHTVLPDRSLPMVAEELEEALADYLSRSDVAIHFVGGRYGWIPDGAEESLVVLQNRAAARRSAEAGLSRFVWVPRDVDARDDRQATFLKNLAENPDLHRGAEVIRDTIENLKGYLRERWQAESEARKKESLRAEFTLKNDSADLSMVSPRVYLICDQRDETAVEPLEDFFFDHGIEVSLPSFEGDESEISEVHWGNLADCDAALVYYGAAGKAWVDYKLRELVKATGYRQGKPIALQAVYLAPPFDRRKERFRSLSATVLRQGGESLEPALLADFVAQLKPSSER